MRKPELAQWIAPRIDDPVELRVQAETRQLAMLRSLAHWIATREHFTAEAVTDVLLAVSEASTQLIERAAAGAILTCRFAHRPGELRVTVSATTRAGVLPDRGTLSWKVLATVTDSLAAWRDEPNGHRTPDLGVHILFGVKGGG